MEHNGQRREIVSIYVESIKSILSVTYNYKNVTCKQFHNEIKNDSKLLSQVLSSKKYETDYETEETLL